ncbi:MAG: phospholipase A2 [Circular genetic element sp.]|nr:MAG: phospholipase A2 [Circular genetic element sp.]
MKIHGNWCGPNWTGGRRLTAQEYDERGLDWNSSAISPLDEACRLHDYEGRSGKMPRAADTRLIKAAEKRILPFLDQLKLELEQTKLILSGKASSKRAREIAARIEESSDAALISTGISIVREFRQS